MRSRSLPERLDAATKAAEVLARYLATLALASFAARDEIEPWPKDKELGQLVGPLSFGHYVNVVRQVAEADDPHPLAPYFRSLFTSNKRGPGKGMAALDDLLQFRNTEGHDLRHIDDVKAQILARDRDPVGVLTEAIGTLSALLRLPLVVIDDQRIRGGTVTATCLRLEGEGAPFPEDLDLATAAESIRSPYLATKSGIIDLSPWMIWEIVERQQAYGVFFLDKVLDGRVDYKAVADGSLAQFSGFLPDIVSTRLRGELCAIEDVVHTTGISIPEWWRSVETGLAEALPHNRGAGSQGGASSAEAEIAPAPSSEAVGSLPEAPAPESITTATSTEVAAVSAAHGPSGVAATVVSDSAAVPPKDPRLTRTTLLELLAVEGRSAPEVADELGVPTLWVRQAVRYYGLHALLKTSACGVTCNAEQVARYEAGASVGELAAALELSQPGALRALVAGGAELRSEDSAQVGGLQPRLSRSYLDREFLQNKRSLKSIGEDVGLSHERVRQLLLKYGMPTRVQRAEDPADRVSEPFLQHLYVVQGLSLSEIAGRLDLRTEQVADLAARYELARPRVYERHGLTADLMNDLYLEQRKSVDAIAEELNVPRQAVDTALVKHGIAKRSRREALSRGLNETLSPEYLRERIQQGASAAQIAEDHGTTITTVRSYLKSAGLLPDDEPDPAYDELLTPEFIQHEYLDAGVTQVEFCARHQVPINELRLRMRRAGLHATRRRNTQLDDLPSAASIRAASAAGRPHSFPLTDQELRERYIDEGVSTAELAAELGVSVDEVLRALCASGVAVRTGMSDVLSEPYLRRRYLGHGASAAEIAREQGVSPVTVTKHLDAVGIETRGRGSARRNPAVDHLTQEFLEREYVENGRSAASIAEETGVTPHTVLATVRRFDLPVRRAAGGPTAGKRLKQEFTAAYLAKELIENGRTCEELASKHDTTPATVRRYAQRLDIELPKDR